MSPSIILGKLPSEIRAAMGVALLQLKNAHKLSLDDIGSVIGRSRESVSQYIAAEAEMGATCWMLAEARWPELRDRLTHNLDEAEKAFRARQRALDLRDAA
jgi:hypothetical protein